MWLIDGTFKTSPALFYQLYTIHGVHGGVVVPFVYVYMPGKSEELYTELFTAVRNKTYGEPEIIISDFEKAAINAAKNVFPATEFFGCLFHLTQNIFRHIQQTPEVLARYGIQRYNIQG